MTRVRQKECGPAGVGVSFPNAGALHLPPATFSFQQSQSEINQRWPQFLVAVFMVGITKASPKIGFLSFSIDAQLSAIEQQ